MNECKELAARADRLAAEAKAGDDPINETFFTLMGALLGTFGTGASYMRKIDPTCPPPTPKANLILLLNAKLADDDA